MRNTTLHDDRQGHLHDYDVRFRRVALRGAAVVAGVAAGTALAAGATLAWAASHQLSKRRERRQSFRDQCVLITGGSRGLGLVLARKFAAEGAHVAICARDGAALASAAEELRASGADVDAFTCDITKPEEAERAVQRLISRWGRIDVLVNNAGTIVSGPFQHTTIEDYEEAMGVYFWGPLHLTRAAVPHMRRQRGTRRDLKGRRVRGPGGRIINITSIGGRVAVPHLLPYCSAKFAEAGLSGGLHAELAREGIAVTTVVPGLMRTGSHLNARFRGHHRREFAWFALLDSLPLTSVDVDRAAQRIVDASRARRPRLVIGPQAKALLTADALLPGVVATTMALINRVLPRPRGAEGNEERRGFESRPRWMPSIATRLGDRAAERNNEIHPRAAAPGSAAVPRTV
jgi:NAD(P)-dependent dehydrogenase (short-subunit alcohol dehydrogenase family)